VRGHLRERGAGVWRLYVDLGRDPLTRRRRQLTRTFRGTRRAAQTALAALVAEVAAGTVDPANATVAQMIDAWWAHTAGSLEPNTRRAYRSKIDCYLVVRPDHPTHAHLAPGLGARRLRDLTAELLDGYYRTLRARGGKHGRPLTARTVNHVHRILHRACAHAVRWGWMAANPVSLSDPPPVPPAELQLPAAEVVARLVAAADGDLADIAWLAVATWAREAELCGLQWRDLDVDRGELVIARRAVKVPGGVEVRAYTKNKRPRRIAVDAVTVARLADRHRRAKQTALACGVRLSDRAFVLSPEPDGTTPLSPNALAQRWRRHAARHGVALRFHDLRHYAISEALAAGIDLPVVAARAGHTDGGRVTLAVYAHARPAGDRRAAEAVVATLTRRSGSRRGPRPTPRTVAPGG
jgi:integrase